MKLNIEDIVPASTEFKLSGLPEVKLKLRPKVIADQIWAVKKYGLERLKKIFTEVHIEEIAAICFYQMEAESQKRFRAQEVTVIDEAGEESKVRLGGAALLLRVIQNASDINAILNALSRSAGLSQKMIDQIVAAEKEEQEKKSQLVKPTGPKSSTSLPPSTAGQPRKLSSSRSAKSSGGSKKSARD